MKIIYKKENNISINIEYFFIILLNPSKDAENINPNIKEKKINLNCKVRSII